MSNLWGSSRSFCHGALVLGSEAKRVRNVLMRRCTMDHAMRVLWIWDTCFMAHFCKYAPWEFPGIDSLSNFYGLMFPEGELKLPKVIGNRWSCGPSGIDDPREGKLLDFKLALPDNPPLFAWTEYRYALQASRRRMPSRTRLSATLASVSRRH